MNCTVLFHMAETTNISKMAELLSSKLFKIFKWSQHGPMNANNACDCQKKHGVKTHPADVVFSYKDPYSGQRIYLLTDLKSYSAGSISYASVRDALVSLAKSVECAQIDQKWQSRYTNLEIEPYNIQGMLFIYNHDSKFDSDFRKNLEGLKDELPKISTTVKISILSPEEIYYLNNISADILRLMGERILPFPEDCFFFYPDLQKKVVIDEKTSCATIELLKEPWQILRYKSEDNLLSSIVYYRGTGESAEEFLYLIDMLSFSQLLANSKQIQIRCLTPNENASVNFDKALKEYINSLNDNYGSILGTHDDISKKFDKITFSSIDQVTKTFSSIEIGMDIR